MARDLLTWWPFGIAFAGLEHSNDTRATIKALGVRVAEIMGIDGTPMSLAFGLLHKKASELTAKYMLERGRRRFSYISKPRWTQYSCTKAPQRPCKDIRKSRCHAYVTRHKPVVLSMVVGLK